MLKTDYSVLCFINEYGFSTLGCTEDEFKCTDGTCIPYSQKCDGIAQCTDFMDEENCKPRSVGKCK